VVLFAFACTVANADTQTDWSGGDGVTGPVSDWGSVFNLSSGVDWILHPDSLLLSTDSTIVKHTVDDNFDDAFSVYAADVDADGDLDVLGAAYDADDIAWWSLHAFTELGTLESSILQLDFTPGDSISWGTVTWLCDEPDSTGLAFLVRSSDDATNMGEWSDTITVSGFSTKQFWERTTSRFLPLSSRLL